MRAVSDSMVKSCKADADAVVFEMQVRICKAFANPVRLKFLELISKREYTVSELQSELDISLPNVSQHLAILKAAGVVSTRRNGKQTYCFLTMPEVKHACQMLRDVLRAQVRKGRRLVA
jgi:ArsR family transcriptional regulator